VSEDRPFDQDVAGASTRRTYEGMIAALRTAHAETIVERNALQARVAALEGALRALLDASVRDRQGATVAHRMELLDAENDARLVLSFAAGAAP